MKGFVILLFIATAHAGRHSSKLSDSLSTDGEWRPYLGSTKDVPDNAVYAGYDRNGPAFVARADITTSDGHYIGKVLGKFFPIHQCGYFGHAGVEYRKTSFELLIHPRAVWAEKEDTRPIIPGSNGKNICRMFAENEDFWTPGRLDTDMKFCTITYSGRELFSPYYQVLRRTC